MRSRPFDGEARVRLEAVTALNRQAVAALDLLPQQRDFVASNAESLEEAGEDDEAIPRVVVADGRIVGFLMYSAPEDSDSAIIYRLMVDYREQGRGYGRAALAAALEEIARRPHVCGVAICYAPGNEAARRLYAGLGFVERGLDEDGQMIAVLELSR